MKSIGDRLIYCRNMLGFTRKNLSDLINISTSSLSRWELNYIKIPTSQIKKFVIFFENHGINVSAEWLEYGTGIPPLNANFNNFTKDNIGDIIYSTLLDIKNKTGCFEFKQVNNNFFSPEISFGDYVGGFPKTDYTLLNNKMCFAITTKNVIAGYFSLNGFYFKNQKNEIKYIDKNEDLIIGEVLWIAKHP